jgi:hypothetical protein
MEKKNAFYTCPYCEKEYSNPVDLAHCILSCEEKQRIAEEKAKREKLVAEKDTRYKEVLHAYENFEELRSKFVDDYGYFTFESTKGMGDWFLASLGLL